MNRYKILLWDLDGTLTDSAQGILACVRHALKEMGFEEPPDIMRFVGPPLYESFSSFCGMDEEQTLKAVKLYRERYSQTGLFENRVYDGVEEMLIKLKAAGCRMSVATSKPEVYAVRILEKFGLAKYFEVIGGADINGTRNEKYEVINYVLERMEVTNRAQVLMIGDRKHDIIGANRTGLAHMYVLWGYGSREEALEYGAKYIADTPARAAEIIESMEECKMANVVKGEQIYEGKAKKVYATNDPDIVIVDYKDDATAFNGEKKGTISGKGVINNRMTNFMFKLLENEGVPTHLIEEISDRETIVKKVEIVPLEVIIRNTAAGSFSKRMGVEEGRKLLTPILEYSYKNDDLGDPFINDYYALALGLATKEELDTIAKYAFKVNEFMLGFFKKLNIDLIDFKIEFGRTSKGEIILADEISPDTCRFWDSTTHEKLDKDRFRRDMGGVEEAYQEIMKRLGIE